MIFAFLLAAALAVVPTVDPIEARLAARDAAIDDEWLSTTNRAALEAKIATFRTHFREKLGVPQIVREGVSVESAAQKEKDSVLRERMGTDCRAVLTELKGSPMRGKRAVLHLGGTATDGELTAALFAEGSRYVPKPQRKGKVSYYERKGGETLVAVELYLEGRSLVALRAAEILTLAAHLEKATGQKAVLIAEGHQTTPARFAVAADPTAFAEVAFK